jgi:hypothetical protein
LKKGRFQGLTVLLPRFDSSAVQSLTAHFQGLAGCSQVWEVALLTVGSVLLTIGRGAVNVWKGRFPWLEVRGVPGNRMLPEIAEKCLELKDLAGVLAKMRLSAKLSRLDAS